MNNLIPIDASRARNEFFKILERVYLEDEAFLVKKAGIPVAEIKKPKKVKRKDILEFAGIWKDLEAKKIIDYLYEGRKDKGKAKRKLPKVN